MPWSSGSRALNPNKSVANESVWRGDGQLSEAEQWSARHVLQGEPRLLLFGTSRRPWRSERPDRPMFGLFQQLSLEPLDAGDCGTLWGAVSGRALGAWWHVPLRILSGGNPRLLTAVARSHEGQQPASLLDILEQLVDAQTDRFACEIDSLPPKLRRVFVTLASLWTPSTAREVADAARLEVSEVSAMLSRLVSHGRVTVTRTQARTHHYGLVEPSCALYVGMRQGGALRARLEAFVRFATWLYLSADLPSGTPPTEAHAAPLGLDAESSRLADELASTASRDPLGALQQLERSPLAPELSPLLVALRLRLGLPVDAPTEVLKVARDTERYIAARSLRGRSGGRRS